MKLIAKIALGFGAFALLLGASGCSTNGAEQSGPANPKTVGVNIVDHAFWGGENALVVIVEFNDYQCPACGATFPAIKRLHEEYGDKIKIVIKHFPLSQIHPFAQKAAEAAEAAGAQGKFWEMTEKLFANQQQLDVANLKRFARELNLNGTKFDQELDAGTFAEKVRKDYNEGIDIGVEGTPTILLNGTILKKHDYETLKSEIDAALSENN